MLSSNEMYTILQKWEDMEYDIFTHFVDKDKLYKIISPMPMRTINVNCRIPSLESLIIWNLTINLQKKYQKVDLVSIYNLIFYYCFICDYFGNDELTDEQVELQYKNANNYINIPINEIKEIIQKNQYYQLFKKQIIQNNNNFYDNFNYPQFYCESTISLIKSFYI